MSVAMFLTELAKTSSITGVQVSREPAALHWERMLVRTGGRPPCGDDVGVRRTCRESGGFLPGCETAPALLWSRV
jgi:hypothetical protein